MGHVRDLPPKAMGVDVEHDFAPTYEPLAGRRKVLAELKKQAREAREVFLATDLDREGEAIAWHLAESLGVAAGRIRRVIFNEITPAAIREAFAHPHDIDMNKVNAQQARRILDRIVGYEVSPAAVAEGRPGAVGRARAVGGRAADRRPRAGDRRLRPGGVLEDRGRVHHRRRRRRRPRPAVGGAAGPARREGHRPHARRAAAVPHRAPRLPGRTGQVAGRALQDRRAPRRPSRSPRRWAWRSTRCDGQEDPSGKGPARHRVTVVGRLARRSRFRRPQSPAAPEPHAPAGPVHHRLDAAGRRRCSCASRPTGPCGSPSSSTRAWRCPARAASA